MSYNMNGRRCCSPCGSNRPPVETPPAPPCGCTPIVPEVPECCCEEQKHCCCQEPKPCCCEEPKRCCCEEPLCPGNPNDQCQTPCGCVEPVSGCPCGKDCTYYPLPDNACEGKKRLVKCTDQDGSCGLYNEDCRNRFWPEFAHPRWLCCRDLYCGR